MKHTLMRRKQLMDQMLPNSVALIPAASEQTRNSDSHYPYRQSSDFFYLTGFNEPDALAVLHPGKQSFILFNRADDPTRTIWQGPCAGQTGACREFGADLSWPITAFKTKLPDLLQNIAIIYYPMGIAPWLDQWITEQIASFRLKKRKDQSFPQQLINLDTLLHEARLIKSTDEITQIQKAVDVSIEAHLRAMHHCKPDLYEYHIEAELLHVFHQAGCRFSAYNPIVAGGFNACVLHYEKNNEKLHAGDLLLIDAGAEYNYYAADLTRTFPVNGLFTQTQQAIYEIVLAAQTAGIEAVKPGNDWTEAQGEIIHVITQGLIDLSLLKGELNELIETKAYAPFYMHNSGHWLGLDVHDVGSYYSNHQSRKLQPNMVLTVEPGIYISPDCKQVDEKWRGIGIRIEDDVLVTQQGNHLLSSALPKTVQEIQHVMKR